jgi:hypothetical protein
MQASRTGYFRVTGKQTRVGNLARSFAPALRDRKAHHGSHTVPCAAQGLERFSQAKPERADDTRRRNCHAGWIIRAFLPVCLSHYLTPKIDLDFYCFLKRSILQVTAKRETEARKLVDCQLSLFNGDLKSDKRKQLPGCVF